MGDGTRTVAETRFAAGRTDVREPDVGIVERILSPTEWPEAVATTEGPQLVVAGPGAGKTEFLVRRVSHLVEERGLPGSHILALTFSRRSAADLRARIGSATGGSWGAVAASTFHSFGHRLLELYGSDAFGWTEVPSVLTGPEQVDLVSELLSAEPPDQWHPALRKLLGSRTLAAEVTEFILRAREGMLTTSELLRRSAERDYWAALPAFVASYDAALARINRLDYGTLLTRVIMVLETEEALETIREQYRYLLVDEYQDTTPVQATLLRVLSRRNRNLTVAADPYQSIYAFRGAALSNVSGFVDDLPRSGSETLHKWILGTSFRLPREILEAAERLTTGVSLPGATGHVQPAPHPGLVEIRVFDQESEESDWIAAEAGRLHLEQEIPYRRMAVLVRTKRRLLKELSRALERRAIPHDRPDRRLVDHPAARMVFDLARAARAPDRRATGPPVRRLLLGPLFDLGIGRLRQMERDMESADTTWPAMIRREVEGGEPLAALLEDPAWTCRRAIDAFWHVWTRLPQFGPMVTDPDRDEFRAVWTSLAQTLVSLEERSPATTLADYIRMVESDDFEASPLLSYRNPAEDRMSLTTMHQAKGLEFDIVFIADAVEGVLPDLRRNQSLLQTELLDLESTGGHGSATRRLEEETRLMYTAMTRARSRVVVTATSAGFDEEHRRPSRFLEAVAGDRLVISTATPRRARPLTIRETESWLRTVLADPAEPGHRRLAAARVLAAGAGFGLREPALYAPIHRPGADTGLVQSGRRLSPSDAVTYDACPRQFALQRVLKVDRPPGPYLTFGILIHQVLEMVERLASEDDRRSTLEEALGRLDELFGDFDFGSGSINDAWLRRARMLLTRLYEGWPNPEAVPVLLEHPVGVELGGMAWRGRIDRIERDADGALRIVDYKTAKTPPPSREAATSLQLGFYSVAAGENETVEIHGPVTEAEFWYPLADSPTRRTLRFNRSALETTRRRLADIARRIARDEWAPRPGGACNRCHVRLVCPAWPEGQEAYRR